MIAADEFAEVRIQRQSDVVECVVVVSFRGRQLLLRCRDYEQAVKWARVECKSYGVARIIVEQIVPRPHVRPGCGGEVLPRREQ